MTTSDDWKYLAERADKLALDHDVTCIFAPHVPYTDGWKILPEAWLPHHLRKPEGRASFALNCSTARAAFFHGIRPDKSDVSMAMRHADDVYQALRAAPSEDRRRWFPHLAEPLPADVVVHGRDLPHTLEGFTLMGPVGSTLTGVSYAHVVWAECLHRAAAAGVAGLSGACMVHSKGRRPDGSIAMDGGGMTFKANGWPAAGDAHAEGVAFYCELTGPRRDYFGASAAMLRHMAGVPAGRVEEAKPAAPAKSWTLRNNDDAERIAARIRNVMGAGNCRTLADLAQHFGVNRATVGRWMDNDRFPQVADAFRECGGVRL